MNWFYRVMITSNVSVIIQHVCSSSSSIYPTRFDVLDALLDLLGIIQRHYSTCSIVLPLILLMPQINSLMYLSP